MDESDPPEAFADVNEAVDEEWAAETTPYERVRSVVAHTYSPVSAADVAEEARTAPKTARKHLTSLAEEGFVETATGDHGATLYRRSPESLVADRTTRTLLAGDDPDDGADPRRSAMSSWRWSRTRPPNSTTTSPSSKSRSTTACVPPRAPGSTSSGRPETSTSSTTRTPRAWTSAGEPPTRRRLPSGRRGRPLPPAAGRERRSRRGRGVLHRPVGGATGRPRRLQALAGRLPRGVVRAAERRGQPAVDGRSPRLGRTPVGLGTAEGAPPRPSPLQTRPTVSR